MQPIGNIWNQFPRTVRDVAHACGKEVQVAMEGKETELDKTIIEAIKDPLTHLVRNSVDHGIELPEDRLKAGKERSGRLILRAYHEGGQVNIEITDDGAGLKADRIRQKAIDRNLITAAQASHMTERDLFPMIFLPGFSTAEKITNVSGRGVGMDVVKTNVEKIGGTVDIQSTAGRGTTVRVKIPLTLAIVPALVVTCGGERYAIPQVSLLELVRIVPDDVAQSVEQVHGTPVYRLRGRLLPLVYLRDELKLAVDASAARREAVNIVVLQADDRQFGLVVDEINDTEEIVVKPLRQQLKMVKTFAGSSIMGDGRVALILDVLGLAQRANVVSQVREAGTKVEDASSPKSGSARQTLLLLQAGAARRMAIPLSSVARLEEFPAGAIERSGKQEVVQYRGRILPLVRVAEVIEGGAEIRSDGTVPLQVVVYTEQERSVGLVVEKILDIVEEEFVVEHRGKRSGILGSALIQKRVTDLLDVEGVVRSVEPGFFELEPQRQTAEWSE
jgi:two-component system chemotaxis sensor kinase CheA